MADVRRMRLGELVDFVEDYNLRQKIAREQENRPRKATQADIDAYFGG